MYSILIFDDKNRWKYLTNPNGSQYIATTLVAVQDKVKELLKTNSLNNITVVKNCTITESIVVTETEVPEDNNE